MKRRRDRIDRAVRRDDLEKIAADLHRPLREVQVRLARAFFEIDTSLHFVYRGCSSVRHLGTMLGYTEGETKVLALAGAALEAAPYLSERILRGSLTLEAAAVLGRVLRDERYQKEGDDWLGLAETLSLGDLKKKVRERVVEVDEEEPTSSMTVVMTSSGREKFERARGIACRKHGKVLDEGKTVEVLSDHYLDSFDEERKVPRKRRMPDTSDHPGRTVPAEVRREVLDRARENGWVRCAYPGCQEWIFLELTHGKAHAEGGSREADNIDPLCGFHHDEKDSGLIKFEDGRWWVKGDDGTWLEVRERGPPG
jgi:hypothetical protein